MKKHTFRHGSAFILLFIAKKPSYGFELLKSFDENLELISMDSAGVYRTLKKLETEECISSSWETSDSGGPKKMYHITKKGLNTLSKFKEDMIIRKKNLDYFINTCSELGE